MNIKLKDLAIELGLTRQNLNYHILKGRAGEIKKKGDKYTSELAVSPSNICELIDWLFANGRHPDKTILKMAYDKYTEIRKTE